MQDQSSPCSRTPTPARSVSRLGFAVVRSLLLIAVAAVFVWAGYIIYEKNLGVSDLSSWFTEPAPIGVLAGDPFERLGAGETSAEPAGTEPADAGAAIRYRGITKYLNDAKAVVTHTADDSIPRVPDAIEVLDRYDVKATFFISTRRGAAEDLWPVLAKAVENGHEIGSHAATHPCQFPPSRWFCAVSYSDYELADSRDDILAHTGQPYVWSFAYPCGLCNEYDFVRRKLRHAGYLTARIYPDEANGGHLLPDMNTWDSDRYRATYTQAVQKKAGIAPEGRRDVAVINAKFDEVYEGGGIYNFLTHPSWLDYDPGNFYEQHVSHISRRDDIWYVPTGPLYAYQDAVKQTKVRSLGGGRFAIAHNLSPKIYPNSVTLAFGWSGPAPFEIRADERVLELEPGGPTYGWDREYYRMSGERLLVTVRPNSVLEIGRSER